MDVSGEKLNSIFRVYKRAVLIRGFLDPSPTEWNSNFLSVLNFLEINRKQK